jgi:20S proteasome alpha/beta subunit
MTCCVAALCDRRKSIVLVADKMVGSGFSQAELKIKKIRKLNPDWRVMIAGNDISPAFDIIDKASIELGTSEHTVGEVEDALARHFRERRADEATALRDPDHILDIQLLTAGFDKNGVGHLLTVSNPGIYKRHDIPGFHAIGSGSFGAYYMLLWREIDIYMKSSLALYYAFEAKIFGESAPGVGFETDMYILRKGQPDKKVSKASEEKMAAVWNNLKPRFPKPEHRRGFERLKEIKELL